MQTTADQLFSLCLLDLASQKLSPHQEVAAQAFRASFLKKWCPEDTCSEPQERLAIEKFHQANDACRGFELTLETWQDEELFLLFQEEWNGFLNVNKKTGWGLNPLDLSPLAAASKGAMGPGRSVGVKHLSFYGKMFHSHMTAYDQELYTWYSAAISESPEWLSAEQFRQRSFGSVRVVDGSRLSVVPKNVDVGRTICSEASLNMFFQLGQGQILSDRLRAHFGIDIDGQKNSPQPEINRELARLGSIDGSYATIDLKSASDSISRTLLMRITPSEAFWALDRTRATHARVSGELVELSMMSSMGNGYTFPLQTALFASAVAASFRMEGRTMRKSRSGVLGNFSVFGDDIIVPKEIFRTTLRILRILGFTVNTDKTYSDGLFRESCGADWHEGYPVRGVYCQRFDSLESRFVLYNKIFDWSRLHGIQMSCILDHIIGSIPRSKRYRVPIWESPDAGIRSLQPPAEPKKRIRRSRDPLVSYVESYGWTYLARQSENLLVPVDEDDSSLNWAGLHICFLGGYVQNGCLSLKPDKPRYETAPRFAVNWEIGQLNSPLLGRLATLFP